jgi:CsoR family transcriptional regulator, copper-sensing transcriptional repressor
VVSNALRLRRAKV